MIGSSDIFQRSQPHFRTCNMKSNLIFLLFLIFFASCTIQKRVHNRGWHVQWNAKRSVSNQDSKEEKSTIALTEMSEVEDEGFLRNSESVGSSFAQTSAEQTNQVQPDLPTQTDQAEVFESSIDEILSEQPMDSVELKNAESVKSSSSIRVRDLILPIVLFVLAVLLLALAVYLGVIALTAADLGALVAFAGACILGLLGMVLLMIAIVVLSVALKARKITLESIGRWNRITLQRRSFLLLLVSTAFL